MGHRGFDVSHDGELATGEHLIVNAGERDASGGFTHGEGADDGGMIGVHEDSFLLVVLWNRDCCPRRGWRARVRPEPEIELGCGADCLFVRLASAKGSKAMESVAAGVV